MIKDAIQEIKDVGTITVAGVREQGIWVEVDQEQMDSLNITFPQRLYTGEYKQVLSCISFLYTPFMLILGVFPLHKAIIMDGICKLFSALSTSFSR